MIKPTNERLEKRQAAILISARKLFISQGFSRTTLKNVVEDSGGSLATVYKLFGNKDGLLNAVISKTTETGAAIVTSEREAGGKPAEILMRIGDRLNSRFLDPEEIALARIVIARSLDEPEFARQFFETSALSTRNQIERLFIEWQAEGVPMNGEPKVLAEIFYGLLIGDLQNEAISHGAARLRSQSRLRQRSDFFLKGAML